jgi:hypothetical protein
VILASHDLGWRGDGVSQATNKGGGGDLSSSVVSLERGGGEFRTKMEVVEDCKETGALYRSAKGGEVVWRGSNSQ